VLSVANLLANWVIPFLVLLPRPAKHDESQMLRVCALLLVGRWLDLYLIVQPVFEQDAPVLGLWEIAPMVAAAALFVIFLRRGLAAADLVPRVECLVAERAIGLEVKARRRQNSLTIRRRRNVEIEFEGRSGAMHSTVTVH